jgi:hypothetical protein
MGCCAYTGGMDRLLIKETGGSGMSAFIGSGHNRGCRLTTALSCEPSFFHFISDNKNYSEEVFNRAMCSGFAS